MLAPYSFCFSSFILSTCLLTFMASLGPSSPPPGLFPVYLPLPRKLTSPLEAFSLSPPTRIRPELLSLSSLSVSLLHPLFDMPFLKCLLSVTVC